MKEELKAAAETAARITGDTWINVQNALPADKKAALEAHAAAFEAQYLADTAYEAA